MAGNAVIGQQPPPASGNNRGNEWLGSYAQWGAWNENTPLVQSSKFKYDLTNNSPPLNNPAFYPGTVNPSTNWFSFLSATEDECLSTIGCEALRPGCDGESLTAFDYQVAEHFITLSAEWPDETRWVAERNLYNKLLRCPLLMQHELMVNFFNSFSEYDSRRLFSEIEHQLAGSTAYNSVNDSVLAACDSLLLLFTAQIDSINLLISDALSNGDKELWYALMYQIRGVQQQQRQVSLMQQQLLTAINEQRQLTAGELRQDNLAATFIQQYENNQQQFNNIYLSGIASGDYNIDSSQLAVLNSIADQCPYSGGPAVYQARAKLIALQGSRRYDDRQICYQNNLAWRHAETEVNNIQLSIHPNPGSEMIKINYQFENDNSGRLLISNTLGNLIYSANLDKNNGQQVFDAGKLSNGIYFVRILSEGGKSIQRKIVINK